MGKLSKITFLIFIGVFMISCFTSQPTDKTEMSETVCNDSNSSNLCEECGERQLNGLYCGFGWKWFDFMGAESFGAAMLETLKMAGQLLIWPFYVIEWMM